MATRSVNADAIPQELRARPQWVTWRREERDGKPTKVPYSAAWCEGRASATAPETWATFETALEAAKDADGVGYVFAEDDPFVGIDLDGCRDPETGSLTPEAGAIVAALDSYTEASPSGTGVHVLLRGALPREGPNRNGKVEMYSAGRYFAMTGEHVRGTPETVEARQAQLKEVRRHVFPTPRAVVKNPRGTAPVDLDDQELIARASAAKNGAAFERLWNGDTTGYPSRSEADLALVAMLAFWTGGDAAWIDGLFRLSGLMRPKWERPDYRERTIAKAIAGTTDFYEAPVQGIPVPSPAEVAPPRLTVISARDLCALPDPPASEELLGPVVVRGQRTIIGAHTGEGKTTLTIAIARAVTAREQLLEWHGSGGRALVLDAEQGLKTIKRRLREAGLADSTDVDYIRVPDGLSLDSNEQDIAEVEQILAAGGYALVAADPLYKLHTGDSNAEREAVDLMRRFDGWRERFRFNLLLPVHCRKPVPGTRFTIHDLFGSSAYVRGAEVVLGLQRVADGYSKLHFLKDRDGDLPIGAKWGLLFDRDQGFRRDPKDGKRETALDKVRELREADPTLTPAQLVEASGYSERSIRGALSALRDEHQQNLLEQDGTE
jgi:hypothetical protein